MSTPSAAGRWARWRREGRLALELVLLPGLAAVLPWRWCFALFKRMAHWRWLYRSGCEQALAGAQARGMVAPGQEPHWLYTRRLLTLVDHADLYLSRWRGDGWMRRWLDVSGQWPAPGQAGVFCTFHWGAGMWGLRHAASAGMCGHALVASLEADVFKGQPVLGRYARWRTQAVARALGRPVMQVSDSLRPVLRALRAGEQVMAAVDVPADQVAASEPVTLRGMAARVPRGLLRLAADQRVPVTVYVTGLDMRTGRRFLRIVPLGVTDDTTALIGKTFAHLEDLLQEDPAAWHFWGVADRFFVA